MRNAIELELRKALGLVKAEPVNQRGRGGSTGGSGAGCGGPKAAPVMALAAGSQRGRQRMIAVCPLELLSTY